MANRRDARVVEWGGLENRCTLRSTKGSNPFLSAGIRTGRKSTSGVIYALFCVQKNGK